METPRVRLGELLVRAGLITSGQLDEALAEQTRVGKRLGSLLVESGLVSETQVTQILSQQLSVPWVSLHHIDFSRELLNLVPLDLVERHCLIPIYVRRVRGLGDALYIAMDDPTNAQALKDVAERSRLHVRAMIAPPSDIRAATRLHYGIGPASPEPVAAAAAASKQRDRVLRRDGEEGVRTGIHFEVASPPSLDAAPLPSPKLDVGSKAQDPPPAEPVVAVPRARPPLPSSSRDVAPPPSSPVSFPGGDSPPSSRNSRDFGTDQRAGERARTSSAKGRGMMALTLLDGTTIQVPRKGKAEKEAAESDGEAAAVPSGEEKLTARDLVAALRAASHGADASEILGENVRWEAMVAALLSVLLKKHLISDREFVDELKKG